MEELERELRSLLADPTTLVVWVALVMGSLGLLIHDLHQKNNQLARWMQRVWQLTVFAIGPLGLIIYAYSGRQQICCDTIWRKGFRSTAQSFAGVAPGQLTALFVVAAIHSPDSVWKSILGFLFSYAAGFAITLATLRQDGISRSQAFWDALLCQSATMAAVEIASAIVRVWLSDPSNLVGTFFWTTQVLSWLVGFLTAYPLNVLLILFGVKVGMHNPRKPSCQTEPVRTRDCLII